MSVRRQTDIPKFVNHVTFWMPVLVLSIAKYFDKLLQNSSLTAIASLGEVCRIMIVTVHFSLVLIITILGTKDGGADGAGEMFDMVFSIQRGDIGPTQSSMTFIAQEIKAPEVIGLAKGELAAAILSIDRKEFRRNDFTTIIALETFQVKSAS